MQKYKIDTKSETAKIIKSSGKAQLNCMICNRPIEGRLEITDNDLTIQVSICDSFECGHIYLTQPIFYVAKEIKT